ncbi:N-acetylmuramoyl-L-alanine amidase [uncultured Holdemanella sp.]
MLLELGYLSNTEDYTKLTNESFQEKIADAIAESFLDKIN